MGFEITGGMQTKAQKVLVYGPEGIGKSTFVSMFPDPVFIDTEDSTLHMDVNRLPKPTSWSMLLQEVTHIKANPQLCKTLILDTADWAEQLCISELCSKSQKGGIEDWGWGKGYTYLAEEFGKLLNLLSDIRDIGIHIVFTAHAIMRKFDQPEENGSYDRWELKLQKKTAPLIREWADMILFANYKTLVINVDGQGAEKGKNKAKGGKRVMYTTHHPCWDAKNRHDLGEELPFTYKAIAHCIPDMKVGPVQTVQPQAKETPVPAIKEPEVQRNSIKALLDLMEANGVTEENIQSIVAEKGYYPKGTSIESYDDEFINGVLVGAWDQVYGAMLEKEFIQLKEDGGNEHE